MKDEVKEVFQ